MNLCFESPYCLCSIQYGVTKDTNIHAADIKDSTKPYLKNRSVAILKVAVVPFRCVDESKLNYVKVFPLRCPCFPLLNVVPVYNFQFLSKTINTFNNTAEKMETLGAEFYSDRHFTISFIACCKPEFSPLGHSHIWTVNIFIRAFQWWYKAQVNALVSSLKGDKSAIIIKRTQIVPPCSHTYSSQVYLPVYVERNLAIIYLLIHLYYLIHLYDL